MVSSKVKLGVVQPEAFAGSRASAMLDGALGYIAEAGARGVDLLVFPETYPGPVAAAHRYDIIEPLRAAARRHGVAVVAGTTEKAPGDEAAYYISAVVISAEGEVLGQYRRTHPRGEVYRGLYSAGPWWEFDYVEADDFPVFDLGWGKLGVSICSEVFVPEVARTLADNGAELCVFPTGTMIEDLGFTETWQTMVRARAIENIMYTATSMNLFGEELRSQHVGSGLGPIDPATGLNRGHAMICSPEHVIGTMRGPGILVAELDLDYIRRMRRDREFPDGIVIPPPYASLPGLQNLRRDELTQRRRADDVVPQG